MTALTKAHLNKLTDDDLRAIALRIVNDVLNALDTYIDEHGLTNHPDLARFHEAVDWLHEILTNPDNGYNRDTRRRHSVAVRVFRDAALDIGKATTGNGSPFPPWLNAVAVDWIFDSVLYAGTPHRLSPYGLHVALDECGGGFIPGHVTTVGYVLKVLCASDDPRLPALAESYIQSGLQANLRPAIDEAEGQLTRLDDLTELNR